MCKCLIFLAIFSAISTLLSPNTNILYIPCVLFLSNSVFIPTRLCLCYAWNTPFSSSALPFPTCMHLPFLSKSNSSNTPWKLFRADQKEEAPLLPCLFLASFLLWHSSNWFAVSYFILMTETISLSHLSLCIQHLANYLAVLRCFKKK